MVSCKEKNQTATNESNALKSSGKERHDSIQCNNLLCKIKS